MAMAAEKLTVMGGGIFGLAIAWECLRRGAVVHLIEADRIGAGSSGGIVGALAPHVPENWNVKKQFQLESLLLAESFWAEVQQVSGIDPGYARLGRLQPLANSAALAQAERRAEEARSLWQGLAEWRIESTPSNPDWAGHSPTGLWVFDTLSARLHPRHAVRALAAAIRTKGGQIKELAKAPIPQAMSAIAETGPVLWATGGQGLADLSQSLRVEVGRGIKGQAALFTCNAPDQPQLFIEGLHFVPHAEGTVAVGSTSERDYQNPTDTDDHLDALVAKARTLCPALADAPVLERWAGLRPRTKSRAPMLGVWPNRPGHFIANGGFKIGFGMAPKVAKVMADLMLEGRDNIPDGFRVEDSL
jgi:glycine oxidase